MTQYTSFDMVTASERCNLSHGIEFQLPLITCWTQLRKEPVKFIRVLPIG